MENNGDQENQEMGTHNVVRHYCKVCNRGFGCAGALGGHMRAHIMGDVSNDKFGENLRFNNKHSYFLRAKTPRFMGYRLTDGADGRELKKLSHGSKSEHYKYSASSEEHDLAHCLVMLSNNKSNDKEENYKGKQVVEKGMFQCKACRKVFNSHQALGGHRASHKKVKGCFAANLDGHNDEEIVDEDSSIQEDNETFTATSDQPDKTTRKRPKMHECSVCRRVFSSGQALGGHKRCHWLTTSTDNAFIPNFHDFQYDHQRQQLYKKPMFTKPHHDLDQQLQLDLNLNLPAPQLDQINAAGDSDQRLYLHQWSTTIGNHSPQKIKTDADQKGGDEKLRKPSDLRDANLDGGWLQMGIASTTDKY
ncbi:hypothetical protein CDL12_15665 [Handroanthus impetiginosus]|uniref:C2H2-type domain-containing protein n=1 Tax=Handroanthus impetiginosus TaxID=429701 RepID=A0A2G9H2I4_9LAMI|nr:hypothetical protein CDL12_15665 [Handroanthus impetiginosus]